MNPDWEIIFCLYISKMKCIITSLIDYDIDSQSIYRPALQKNTLK